VSLFAVQQLRLPFTDIGSFVDQVEHGAYSMIVEKNVMERFDLAQV